LWIARNEPQVRGTAEAYSGRDSLPIWTVIDCTHGTEAIGETVKSIPEAARCIMIGGPQRSDLVHFGSIRELASHIDQKQFWLCPIGCGDRLATGALQAYAATVARADDASVIYADDDLVDRNGNRVDPHFKPDWNPELFEQHDFVTGSSVIRVDRGDLATVPANDWARALVRLAMRRGREPVHLPMVLHHRRRRPQPIIPGMPAELWDKRDWPLVSVIVPTRNGANLLRKCMEGLRRTRYPNMEVIIVDNESDEPDAIALLAELRTGGAEVIRVAGPFNFSRLNNVAVRAARGDVLCFLNNDIEMTDEEWLALLVCHAVRSEIGAVGARLLYPDGTVQHAGVFTGIGGGAAHAHRFVGKDEGGYFDRARLPQRVSAVTAACLAVSREKFLAVGGFDEDCFPVAFNDVDLCLKLNGRGWQSFYEPRSTLIHHESKSRGSDRLKGNRERFAGELAMLKRKWHTDEKRDPYHHPQLSSFSEQFLISI
jgi:GT2 family glycosyltransferase